MWTGIWKSIPMFILSDYDCGARSVQSAMENVEHAPTDKTRKQELPEDKFLNQLQCCKITLIWREIKRTEALKHLETTAIRSFFERLASSFTNTSCYWRHSYSTRRYSQSVQLFEEVLQESVNREYVPRRLSRIINSVPLIG